MPREITSLVYKFSELSDSAKENARNWFRGLIDENDYASTLEDIKHMGELLGITFATRTVPLHNGNTRQEPAIFWQGFGCQGNGLCFEGDYKFRPEAVEEIASEAPATYKDPETGEERITTSNAILYTIALALAEVSAQAPELLGVRVVQKVTRYCHDGTVGFEFKWDVTEDLSTQEVQRCVAVSKAVTEELRRFMRWAYNELDKENTYLNSEEYVDEGIEANEYEFTAEGGFYK